ncbi:MAG: hypothetical protein WAX44_00235 [Minisyncoccia bacterium]
MREQKYSKYLRMRKAVIASASGSLMAGMLLVGAGNVYAESLDALSLVNKTELSGMHLMHKWDSVTRVSSIASRIGLDPEVLRKEIRSGKTMKQILQENGITPKDLGVALGSNKKSQMKRLYKQMNLEKYGGWQ